jgi:hypothetical protein
MKASELIAHLNALIKEHWDLHVVWMGNDSDFWDYSIDEFIFEKNELVKTEQWYRHRHIYKSETTVPVFYIFI